MKNGSGRITTVLRSLASGAAPLTASLHEVAAPPDTASVGAYSSVSDAALYIALDKGYFTEQGIEADIRQVNTGTEMMTQLATGDLDASGGAPGAGVYNAVRQGMEFKIVADKGSSLPGNGYFAFVVRKDLDHAIDERLLIRPAPGHAPGHVVLDLADGDSRALFCGDVCHHPIQVYEPGRSTRFCENPEQASDTRRRALEHCVERGALLFPTHFAARRVARILESSAGFLIDFVAPGQAHR